jgi:hypothetical protein
MTDRAEPGRVDRGGMRNGAPAPTPDPLPPVPSEYDTGDLIARVKASRYGGEDLPGEGVQSHAPLNATGPRTLHSRRTARPPQMSWRGIATGLALTIPILTLAWAFAAVTP